MDENIRTPDEQFMDTLYSPTPTRVSPRRRRRDAKKIRNTPPPQLNHTRYDDLQLSEEELLQHVINLSLQESQNQVHDIYQPDEVHEVDEIDEVILNQSLEEYKKVEEKQKREALFANSEKQIDKLNKIDKAEKLYSTILLYIRLFIESGENIQITQEEKQNINACINKIRLSQQDKNDILEIFII